MRRLRRGVVGAFVVVLVSVGLPPGAASAAGGYFPGQFFAKQYTEALGRVPDQQSWQSAVRHFDQQGCSAQMLGGYGKAIFGSAEFAGLGYDKAARLLALYRGALNREPDRAGYDHWLSQLDGGTSWSAMLDLFYGSPEFGQLVPRICSGVVNGRGSSYDWGTTPAITLPTSGTPTDGGNFAGTQDQLQKLLDERAAAGGGTVALAQKAVVVLSSRLTVPAGLTLTTNGTPSPTRYALLGRLVRGGALDDQIIWVSGGAKLENVWVDGQRGEPTSSHPLRSSVRVLGGTGTSVSGNKFSNSAGPSNVLALGAFDGYACGGLALRGNVITGYSSNYYLSGRWTDGLTVTCEHADIRDNQIVDTSDVAIVLFRSCTVVQTPPPPGQVSLPAQASVASNNTVLSAGNPMYGALGFDPLIAEIGYAKQRCGFAGASISDNLLWTSPNTHFAIGMTVGSRAWYGKLSDRVHIGDGATLTNNTTGILQARVGTGIAVSGMLNAKVSGNTTAWLHPGGLTKCPNVDFAASRSAGTASPAPGTGFPPNTVDVAFDGCIGE